MTGIELINGCYVSSSIEELLKNLPEVFGKDSDVRGCVYAFEIGEVLKIGYTCKISNRLNTWRRIYGTAYVPLGRAAVTIPHINAKRSEGEIHSSFADKAVRKEIFAVSLSDFLAKVHEMDIPHPTEAEVASVRDEPEINPYIQKSKPFQIWNLPKEKCRYKVNTLKFMAHHNMMDYEYVMMWPWALLIFDELKDTGEIDLETAMDLAEMCVAYHRGEPDRACEDILMFAITTFFDRYR